MEGGVAGERESGPPGLLKFALAKSGGPRRGVTRLVILLQPDLQPGLRGRPSTVSSVHSSLQPGSFLSSQL